MAPASSSPWAPRSSEGPFLGLGRQPRGEMTGTLGLTLSPLVGIAHALGPTAGVGFAFVQPSVTFAHRR